MIWRNLHLQLVKQEKCKNAIRMVRDALKNIGYTEDGKEIRSLTEGTYAFALDMRSGSKNIIIITLQN